MPGPEPLALARYRRRRKLIEAIAAEARKAWRALSPADLNGSWAQQAPALLLALSGAQLAAARDADSYLDDVLAAQDIDPAAQGAIAARSLAGIASDGRELGTLLDRPVIATKAAIGDGATMAMSLATGYAALDMIVRTQVADAGRVADQVAMTARRGTSGYVRMVVGATCSRCIVLAGKFYRWNTGFQRHPNCDCVHIPSREAIAGDVELSPRKKFDSMSAEQQDKAFTKAGAEAIRLGADPAQVVNGRRGMQTASVFGRDVQITTEGTTIRGVAGTRLGVRETGIKSGGERYRRSRPPRLMPESILQAANGNRDEAIRLLKRFGYII